MKSAKHLRMIVIGGVVLGWVVAYTSVARAVDVESCDEECTANCELVRSMKCCSDSVLCPDGLGPITLKNGKNLDLKGHDLECFCGVKTCNGGPNNNVPCEESPAICGAFSCENQTGCTTCGTGVTMEANSSQVVNSASTEAKVFGAWTPAVECNGHSATRVKEITFVGLAGNGVVDCAKVDQNVFQNGAGAAIKTGGVADSDFIRDNYVDDFPTGIEVTGTKEVSVDHNLVWLRRSDATGIAGIDVSGATAAGLQVADNLIGGTGSPPIDGNAVSSFAANFCDPSNDDCAACIAAPYCTAPDAPFELP